MKKIIHICLFIIGLLLIPKFVFAQELPREGVHYFMTYPNGEEVVTDSYEEASNPEERLIYAGFTNEQGELTLEGLANEGSLRIVQIVPDGYSTEQTEYTLNLAENNRNVEFVDFRGINPKTGQSFLFVGVLLFVLITAFVLVKGKAKKQALFLIPIVVLSVVVFKVMAISENLVIVIKDKEGNRLNGVAVEVYAKPIQIDSAPAIKIRANGGIFFDGTTEMVLRLPAASCTIPDFLSSLESDELSYFQDNVYMAYREGYAYDGLENKEELTNGTVINVLWEESTDINYIRIEGNGGTFDFYGKKLSSVVISLNYFFYDFVSSATRDNYYLVGFDDTAACSHYGSNGILENEIELNNANLAYACWNSKPDGIYVNDVVFLGNNDTCYYESSSLDYDSLYMSSGRYAFDFTNVNSENLIFYSLRSYTPSDSTTPGNVLAPRTKTNSNVFGAESLGSKGRSSITHYHDIETLEVIKNGEVVVSLTADDILALGTDSSGEISYSIRNSEKLETLLNYFEVLYQNDCFDGNGPSSD